MILKARPLALLTAAVAALVIVGIAWQVSKGPALDAGDGLARPSASASGVVTRVVTPAAAPPAASVATPPSAPAPVVAPPSAAAPVNPAPVAAAAAPKPSTGIKHRVEPRAALPPILPNEVNRVVEQALGHQALTKFLYLEPLARRFVATVDGLGRQQAPDSLWLLRPPPGDFVLAKNRSAEDTSLVSTVNNRRYAGFVRWVETTDTQRLIALYVRLYPLLQQTYVELGHRDAYFNDRVIEVIDLLLATPQQRTPLKVQPAVLDAAAKAKIVNPLSAATPPRPRFELADPALESLSTGQKMLLRVGPQQAARLKLKLTALRAGLVKLGN